MTLDKRRCLTLLSVLSIGPVARTSASAPKSPGTGGSTTSVASSTSSTVATSSPQDQVAVNAIVLHASDLPGSWDAGAVEPNDMNGDPQVDRCIGIPDSDVDETAYAGSPEFTQNTVQIASQTTA